MWKNPKVWSLAIAETITWAGIFYLFPAMLMRWEAYFGWSRVELTFGFTGALSLFLVGPERSSGGAGTPSRARRRSTPRPRLRR